MKPTLLALLLGLAMNFSITDVLAASQNQPYAQNFAQTALSEKDQKVLAALQKAYPQNRIRLARETQVTGFYEVILGEGVSYVFITADTLEKLDLINEKNRDAYFQHWIFGGVFYDMKNQIDLTAPMKKLAQMVDVSKLPVENAITREVGKAENTLFVFTDPRCPFCKKLEEELVKLENVRIHTFLTPLTSLHPDAKEVSARILCAKDKAKAFEDFMLKGKEISEPAQCQTTLEANERLMTELGIKGTPTIFFENGERATGALSAEAIQKKFEAMAAIKKAIKEAN
ncbi:DsbC family protein [Parasutterella secunda]|nr:DsbC family protein [Parasutterella secunda]